MGPTASPLAAYTPKNWTHELTVAEGVVLVALPMVSLVLTYVLLRIVWNVPEPLQLPQHTTPSYGTVPNDESSSLTARPHKTSLVEEGEVAGDYEEHWYGTFDFVFLVGMVVYAAV
ncbi:hypothetical protein BBJ29_007037, partial [Phytophthora kernoviae]